MTEKYRVVIRIFNVEADSVEEVRQKVQMPLLPYHAFYEVGLEKYEPYSFEDLCGKLEREGRKQDDTESTGTD